MIQCNVVVIGLLELLLFGVGYFFAGIKLKAKLVLARCNKLLPHLDALGILCSTSLVEVPVAERSQIFVSNFFAVRSALGTCSLHGLVLIHIPLLH
jgi:hypothetical protein